MKMPKVWEILKEFKNFCKFHGWKTSEKNDWVEADEEYHNFLLVRNVHPTSFKNIVSNEKCIVQEGLSYRVVKASYTAWLFSEEPPETLIKTLYENPDFSKRTAIYDLSPFLNGKNLCIKLNCTDSPVFKEFENFLEKEFKVKLKPHLSLSKELDVKAQPLTETA